MIVVPGQRPRTVTIAPQAGSEAPIGLKGQHQPRNSRSEEAPAVEAEEEGRSLPLEHMVPCCLVTAENGLAVRCKMPRLGAAGRGICGARASARTCCRVPVNGA
jgi:hypothetical protein